MTKIINKIKILLGLLCPFVDKCPHYRDNSATCNGNSNGGKGFNYCGKYREYINDK